MTIPTTVTAVDILGAVHGHHVETIETVQAALTTGAIVRLDGPGEGFYTGITSGDVVTVTDYAPYASGHVSRSVQRLDADGAHLCLNSAMTITAVPTHEWTAEMALSAKSAAERGAQTLMATAMAAASGYGTYAPVNDERALANLRTAGDLMRYAFAVGVLVDYILGLASKDPYVMGHAKRVVN